MRGSVRALIIAVCCGVVAGAHVVVADERSEALDREATNIYQQVFSPFCPGRSLNDCPSSKAAELKDEMRAELEAGKSPEVILQEVFQKYGDQYRAVPPFAGVGMLVWLVPIGFVVIGLGIAVAVSNSRKRSAAAPLKSTPSHLSEEDERRIQEELSRLD
jgi:cytochrome c-type biogenesis protein CcmH